MQRPFRLLADNPEYRRLWLAETVLTFGGGLRRVAVPWLVMELTGDPLQLGLALALGTTPDVLLAPLVGYYVDRRSRRRLMIGAALAEACVVAVVPAVGALGTLTAAHLYAVLVALSVTRAVYHNAREAALPTLVAEADLDAANSAFYVAGTALSAVFTVAGGGLTQYVGAGATLLGAAAATGLAAVPLGTVPAPAPEREGDSEAVEGSTPDGPRAALADFVDEVRAGVAVVRATVVRDVVAFGVAVNLAVVPFSLLVTTISWDVFGVALAYGVLLGSYTAGKLVGNAAVPRVPWSRERTYAVGVLAVGSAALAVAGLGRLVAGMPTKVAIGVLGAALFALGGLQPLFNVPSDSLVQSAADDSSRGKVVTLANAALQVPFPVALLGGGYLASRVSPFAVFGLSGVVLVATGAVAAVRFGVVGSGTAGFESSA